MSDSPDPGAPAPEPPLDSTAALIERIRGGDTSARETLYARYLPVLQRWARGRLPSKARDLVDTDDLVQLTLVRTLNHVEEFEVRREGAFLAYLRTILLNMVRDQVRRAARRGLHETLEDDAGEALPSELERAIGREKLERYEAALAALPEEKREAVILRVEFGFPYERIAEALGRPSANAARMTVVRSLVDLAKAIDGDADA